jgi:hypothetical protein
MDCEKQGMMCPSYIEEDEVEDYEEYEEYEEETA